MTARLKDFAINAVVMIVSVLLTYTVLSVVTFRVLLPYLPLQARPVIPIRAEVFAQSSKADYVPRDYIALLGDSYAEGQGDWLFEHKYDRSRPYHSAHVIQSLTGSDVVSFGRGGAGSAQGIVRLPTQALFDSDCFLLPSVETPKRVVVYFYEGNDISDNLGFISQLPPSQGTLSERIDSYFLSNYGAGSALRCVGMLWTTGERLLYFLTTGKDRQWSRDTAPSVHNKVHAGDGLEPMPVVQAPPRLATIEATAMATEVLQRSLVWLRSRFPKQPIAVIYLPSPAASYRHAQSEVDTEIGRVPASEIERSSQALCREVEAIAGRQLLQFADARPALREAARRAPIHGPNDWNHFNEQGYRVLGGVVADVIAKPENRPCSDWADASAFLEPSRPAVSRP